MPIGVFPGSFDPLTTAHLAIAEAAISTCRLDRLDLALSTVALGKDHGGHTSLDARVAAIERARALVPELGVVVTEQRLIADIATGYDVCVVGADKWHQLHDPGFYDDSIERRDAALARLPQLAVAPRAGVTSPPDEALTLVLVLDPSYAEVSSTAVRDGRDDWRATT